MSDFRHLQGHNGEWLAVQSTLPEPANPTTNAEIQTLRDAANEGRQRVAAASMEQLAAGITTQDHWIPTRDSDHLRARTYRPKRFTTEMALYVHLHGGGFLFGNLNTEDATCAGIAIDAQVTVLNICYRHTPEHTYPCAWNDIEDALQWLSGNLTSLGCVREQVILGGISAGAWLTASTLLNKSLPADLPIAGQVLMVPALVFHECYGPQRARLKNPAFSSYVQNREAPILPLERAKFFSDLLKVEDVREGDLRLNPGNANEDEVNHLPPTVFGIAGLDVLRDEGLLYAQLLHTAGVATNVSVFPGLPHGFRRFGARLSECARWDAVIVQGIKWALGQPRVLDEFVIKTS